MKKLCLIIIGAILVMSFICAELTSADNKKPTIFTNAELQQIVDDWFATKRAVANPRKFRIEVIETKIMNLFLANTLKSIAMADVLETLLYEDYTDAINCATSEQEAEKLKDERSIKFCEKEKLAKSSLRQFPKEFKDETRRKYVEQLVNSYFTNIEPTVKKMYWNHPSRTKCK